MKANGQTHYVIIGTGPAGDEAARELRARDTDGEITLVTASKLLFIRRFDLYKIFLGVDDWRELLVHQPEYYDRQRLNVRRNTVVTRVEPERQVLVLQHKEELYYDKLLIASGGGGYLPEVLSEFQHLIHRFSDFEQAVRVRRELSDGGRVLMLGGDMLGIELAGHLIEEGFQVTIIAGDQLFWPHEIPVTERPRYIEALERMGLEVIQGERVKRLEQGHSGLAARRVIFDSDDDVHGDVVMSFCGFMPKLDFMAGAGLHIERGLLVSPTLATINESIWAAGDVCQIWSPEENRYRFSYEWKNVKNMGRVAAVNMTGGNEEVNTFSDDTLTLDNQGRLDSPFWHYD